MSLIQLPTPDVGLFMGIIVSTLGQAEGIRWLCVRVSEGKVPLANLTSHLSPSQDLRDPTGIANFDMLQTGICLSDFGKWRQLVGHSRSHPSQQVVSSLGKYPPAQQLSEWV